jgi:type VI secretion system protein ImpL
MYSGDQLYRPLIRVYVANMQQGFVKPCKYYLERQLKSLEGERYYEEREQLKKYLMLSDVDNLDVDWATGQFVALWAELQKSTSDVALVDLKKRMAPHVKYYFQLIKPDGELKPRAAPVAANDKIVEGARKTLQSVPVRKRYYSLFVDAIRYELYDPSSDPVRSNLQFPPITLDAMFTDRPEVKNFLKSKQYEAEKKWFEVTGPYTDKGHFAVLANIKEAVNLLESEQWVVPLTNEERGDRVAANVARLADDYEQNYIDAWKSFLVDIQIKSPANMKEAVELFAELQRPEWPYLRILRALEDHTQWKKEFNQEASNLVNRRLNRAVSSRTRGLKFNLDVNKIAGRASLVPDTFKKTVGFGVPQDGGARTPLNETALAQYKELLGALREKMVQAMDAQPDASVNVVARDLQTAVSQIEALLQASDEMAKRTLLPLMQLPLNVEGKIRMSQSFALGG